MNPKEQKLEPVAKRMLPDCWPYIECDVGWDDLLLELDSKLAELAPDYQVLQIKEKYGGLRFYAIGLSDEGLDLIEEYEDRSLTICETCGSPGRLMQDRGWYKTVCDEHSEGYLPVDEENPDMEA